MAKKAYNSPFFFTLEPGDDPHVVLPPSQGTSGEDPQFTWDPNIAASDVTLFWASYDETDLAKMDKDHNLYISADEFYDWLDSIGGF
ncbi:MAG: hypothetical protein IIZ27_10010 [Solobacterium sp.]|nr:hypothetical protein [Solobacterium sp.]